MNNISETEVHPYLVLFNQHVEQLRRHLSGFCNQLPSANSLIGGVWWTAEEKDLFFHALSVHSRLRPDLIAACVGTKNEVEVLEYLSLLEDGSKETGSSEECIRATLSSTREVSDSWVAWEEANAERLRLNEEIWSHIDGEDSQPRDGWESIESDYPDKRPFRELRYLNHAHLRVLGEVLQGENNHGPDADMVTSSSIEINHPNATNMDITFPTQIPGRSDSATSNSPTNIHRDADMSEEDTSAHLQNLSPRSRRRYKKRIHMRRKRAELKGKQTNLTVHKLKTGPRNSTREKGSPEASSSMITRNIHTEPVVKNASPISDDVSDQIPTMASGKDGDNDPSLDPIPRSRHLKAQSDLSLSLDSIAARGLDVFNYPKMGKLLEHFIVGYDSNLVDQNASIGTETCILFLEILKDFLMQVISRVITLEEGYRRLRGTTKVWRKNTDDGTIDSSAIQFALKSMGIVEENLSQFFAGLLGEDCHPATYNQTGYDDNERLINQPSILNQHPLHQDVCPPHYHYTLFQEYCQTNDSAEDMNNVMEDVDDEILINEIQEERELEREDDIADRKHEKALWREVPSRKNF